MAYDMNHEKDVRTKIETVRGQVEFGSWQDLQKAPCDFIDRRFHLAEDYRVIDIDEYITNSLVKSRVAQATVWLSREWRKQDQGQWTKQQYST